MKPIWRVILVAPLLFASLLSALTPIPTQAQATTGIIRGQVVNGTAGGAVADASVTLLPVTNAGPGQRLTAAAGADGRFRFDGLRTDSTQQYVVWAEHSGTRYQVGPISLVESADRSIDITVYDTTESDPGIRVSRNVILIRPIPTDRQLAVVELVEAENPDQARRAYLGRPMAGNPSRRESFRFSLPAGANSLNVAEGIQVNALAQTGEGFSDTLPFPPGPRQIAFEYAVQYVDNALLFTREIFYPTGELTVLVQDGNWTLNADGLSQFGTVTLDGQRFQQYGALNLTPGRPIRMIISGAGLDSIPLEGLPAFQIGIAGVVILMIGAGVAVPLVRRRRTSTPVTSPKTAKAVLPAIETGDTSYSLAARDLVADLAALDDSHESGELDDASWEQLRAAKKAALIEILRQERGI